MEGIGVFYAALFSTAAAEAAAWSGGNDSRFCCANVALLTHRSAPIDNHIIHSFKWPLLCGFRVIHSSRLAAPFQNLSIRRAQKTSRSTRRSE
uniref:Putative secreted protein n=1 Tax=Anopheles darlingi TaxID=43151 RepID=A0A2M4D057_ANODA